LKEENFLKNSRTFSDLKLRVGYGITGQQDGINDYDFLSFYGLSARMLLTSSAAPFTRCTGRGLIIPISNGKKQPPPMPLWILVS